ncbi:MAG: PBSX family phage terminase large subunit, partial [bacterium]
MPANLEVNRKIFEFLRNAQSQTVAVYGGAGAGKSYTIAQFLILKFVGETNKHFLITRKTTPSLRLSSYMLMRNILRELDLKVEENKTELTWEFPLTKNLMVFKGMDDPEKIKSTEFNYIWMEEATEFDLDDYRQLRLRLRRISDRKNQIFLSFNPIYTSWLYNLIVEKPDQVDSLQVNYRDNLRFLSQDYIAQLENLANEDPYFYKVYALGEFAQPSNLIFTNWEVCQVFPQSYDEIIYGLDFGFNNPTALLEIGIKDQEIYIIREFYRSQITNADLIS